MNEPARAAGREFARALAAGLAAAAGCAALWAALIAATERPLGFAAVGLGGAVAYAVRRVSGGRRGPRLQLSAIGLTLAGILLAKFFFVAHAMRELTENAPDRPPNFHLSYLDPRMFKFFARIFPHMLAIDDALWVLLALTAAWLALKPARSGTEPAARREGGA